jgi:hypothetical protein
MSSHLLLTIPYLQKNFALSPKTDPSENKFRKQYQCAYIDCFRFQMLQLLVTYPIKFTSTCDKSDCDISRN